MISATTKSPALALPPSSKQAEAAREGRGRSTYGQILKSSAVIGGSSVVNIGLGIVRTKVMALLLGPGGVGLLGIYSAISDLARTIAGMGINNSGVRQIAEAVGTGDTRRVARTVTTLRRVGLLLGLLGALFLAALCLPISKISFGSVSHAGAIVCLSLAVLFGAISSAQLALLQGLRRIGDLARASIWGGVLGTLSSVLIVWFYARAGDARGGIVPSLVCVAAWGIVVSWWYSRKTQVERVSMRWKDISTEVSDLLKLGVVFMASGFMVLGVAYLVRIIVLRKLGEDAAGFYQAAWTLGGLYVGFILQAMGADFYPRLTGVANNHSECNRLVNEQAEVGLLMAGPGVLGTLTFAPWIISVFYSAKFGPAVEILRWICLGMIMRVSCWPMGFIPVAKGARQTFLWCEIAGSVLQVGLVWVCVRRFGLTGTGIAFFGSYVIFWFLVYGIVRSMSGFRWSGANKGIGLLYGALIGAVFVGWYLLPSSLMLVSGTGITLVAGVFSLKKICRLIPLERLPRLAQRLILLLRLAPPLERG